MAELELPTGYGQVAYEAYLAHCGGKSVHGETLPSWADQRQDIRDHWDAVGDALVRYLNRIPG